MKLTKEKAIEEHRKMWNWIADQLENKENQNNISALKEMYCKTNKFKPIHDCFCCEYSIDVYQPTEDIKHCQYCPILWGSEEDIPIEEGYFCESYMPNAVSWYDALMLSLKGNYAEAAEIARQITNLPERPNNENDILE